MLTAAVGFLAVTNAGIKEDHCTAAPVATIVRIVQV